MAVTLTISELAAALAVNDALATRLLQVASLLVDHYAPAAPAVIQNEAVIRTAGWLLETPAGAVRSEATGDIRTSYDGARSLGALRNSGAMGLLSAFKVRRAGAI